MGLTPLCHNLGSVWKVPQTSVLFAEVSRKFLDFSYTAVELSAWAIDKNAGCLKALGFKFLLGTS